MANYVVTTRGKDGSLVERAYTANDRADLFKKLADDGVNAVRVREGTLGKKPRKAAASGAPSKGRGLIAAAIVILGVGAAVWFLMPKTEKSVEAKKEPKKQIKAEPARKTPSQQLKKESEEDKVGAAQPKMTEDERLLAGRDTNEWIVVTDPNTGKKHLSKLMRTGLKNLPPPYFKRHSLNVIDAIQYSEMGDPLVGVQIDGRFMEDLKQAMIEKIVVEEGDDEDRIAHKNAMVETLKELKNELRNGGDIKEIILEALSERRRVSSLKDTMLEERRRMRNEGVDEQEIVEFERACNKKLEELGARPMITKELMLKKARERRALLDN